MWSIFKKEWSQFFSSLTGYVSIGVFLLVMGLNVFVFEGNVLESGYATLDVFFSLAPWIMILLVPAITMRSFSEEYQTGTIEMLATKPLSDTQIILGKYFAAAALLLFALLPTLIYFLAVSVLSLEGAGIDTGATWGSYIGLVLLGLMFCAVGLWSSTFSANQIVAFLLGVFLCYLVYDAFFRISTLSVFTGKADYWIQLLGAGAHYDALSRGVVDSRDLVYFLTGSALFLLLTRLSVERKKW
jgi:ABC-2 type transport system permease protein